jgi:L-ribulokinase
MQTMANILEQPIRIHQSDQTCAGGAAMFAATAAGIYDKVEEAMKAMGQGFEKTIIPDQSTTSYYRCRYEKYRALGEYIEQTV